VIWSRAFEKMSGQDDHDVRASISTRPLATRWRSRWGDLARDRGRKLAMLLRRPRYVCMIDAAEVIKSFDRPVTREFAANSKTDESLSRLCGRVSYLAISSAREYLFASAGGPAMRRRSIARSMPRARASNFGRRVRAPIT